MTETLPETSMHLPDICGSESQLAAAGNADRAPYPTFGARGIGTTRSVFAAALHMHQPLIPAGHGDPRSAEVISNLRHMFEHPEVQDAHNAMVFEWCYKRMGEFIPQLVAEGKQPRIMLDYSGCLLWGLQQMQGGVIDALRPLAQDPAYVDCVEWLGTAWGHAVAPSTPPSDFRLHVQAWRHHFASIFGVDALSRVRGFSPPEMALPNHPDVAYAFVKTLRDNGYRWVMVQEHSVEQADGTPVRRPHLPHRLVARDAQGRSASIVAIIKTQGSDTKLVGQMQPYYEAKSVSRTEIAGRSVQPIVTQIADGENGGGMMKELPPMYLRVMQEAGVDGADTRPVNASEYLAYLESIGIREDDLPAAQPVHQHKIWNRLGDRTGPEALEEVIRQLRVEDGRFHVEGGSWTNNISWTRGYEKVLGPMEAASVLFNKNVAGLATSDPRYRESLFYLLLAQTSCFRYWGEGAWADYGREFCRRAGEVLSR